MIVGNSSHRPSAAPTTSRSLQHWCCGSVERAVVESPASALSAMARFLHGAKEGERRNSLNSQGWSWREVDAVSLALPFHRLSMLKIRPTRSALNPVVLFGHNLLLQHHNFPWESQDKSHTEQRRCRTRMLQISTVSRVPLTHLGGVRVPLSPCQGPYPTVMCQWL